ncbi:MAG: tail fiber domain-containing protein [Candidatus Fonsibacter sp.]
MVTSPITPSDAGIFIANNLSNTPVASTPGITLCGTSNTFPYLSFVSPGHTSYWRGLIQLSLESSTIHFSISGVGERLCITTAGVSVYGTFSNLSDKRLKFNVKPLTNALDVINPLEPVEYDQTYTLVDEYTTETPQSHQSGFNSSICP